jgi:hypothetical protein
MLERLLAIFVSVELPDAYLSHQMASAHGRPPQRAAWQPGSLRSLHRFAGGLPTPTDNRVHFSPSVHTFLDDFHWLAPDLTSRQTRLAEILPQEPAAVGAVDAAGAGMGGLVRGIHCAESATGPPSL